MATLIVKSNASQGTDVLIDDVGVLIPNSGGTETFTLFEDLFALRGSEDLRAYMVDDAFGAGSSTLILNDGTGDIAQADAVNFLDTVALPDASGDYGVVKTKATGEIDAGSKQIQDLAAGSLGTDAVNLDQMNAAIATGVSWREVVLTSSQLDSTNDAVSQAGALYFDGQPIATDTWILTDGTTTETFTFVATETVAFDVAVGASADAAMDNFAQAINDDSTLWSAVVLADLESINNGSGTSTAGKVLVVYRTNQAADSYDDRMYGTWGTQANARYVNFNGEYDYQKSANAALGTADPAQKEFGFGRATASLIANEAHATRNEDEGWMWDSDTGVWQLIKATIAATTGKPLQFSSNKGVPNGGTRYLSYGLVSSASANGIRMPRAGSLVAASIVVDNADATRAYKLSIKVNGSEVDSLALGTSTQEASTTALSGTFSAGDNIAVSCEQTSGSGASDFDEIFALVEYTD